LAKSSITGTFISGLVGISINNTVIGYKFSGLAAKLFKELEIASEISFLPVISKVCFTILEENLPEITSVN